MLTMRSRCLVILLLLTVVMAQAAFGKSIKVAVVQALIENTLSKNRDKLLGFISQAKTEGCHLVIFPEGALCWSGIAVYNPSKDDIDAAITQIGKKARSEKIYVIFGTGYKQARTSPSSLAR